MKERLTELLKGSLKYNDNPLSYCHDEHVGELADHLLANGVVVVDTNKVSAKNLPLITHIAGYPINDVIDLMETKNAGRVVELPCAVGDTVWCIVDKVFNAPLEAKIYSITIQAEGTIMRCGVKGYYGVSYMAQDLGKKFFKTKEEAEAALKEEQQ